MSNDNAKAAKSSEMVSLTVILFAITAITALLLGLVNFITADKIKAIAADKTNAAMAEVMPAARSFTELDAADSDPLVTAVYEADGQGYVFQVSPSGFGGEITMIVGIGTEGSVTGVAIVDMAETSGLGDNAKTAEFRSQFEGLSEPAGVSKDGGEIDTLTGATVTTRAVTNGVNAAIDAASKYLK